LVDVCVAWRGRVCVWGVSGEENAEEWLA